MTSSTPRIEDTPPGSTSLMIPHSPMHVDEDERKSENKSSILPSSPPFHRDQRVWAQDPVTTRYYQATVRDLKWEGSEWKFRIHYQGWNNRWDRWLDASHIADESQKEALSAAGVLTPVGKSKENETENEESVVNSANRKRKNNSNADSKGGTPSRKRRTARNRKLLPFSDQCELPVTLQTVLIEEWERLTRPTQKLGKPPVRHVHVLPASVTIHQVLKHFAKKKKQDTIPLENNAMNPPNIPSDVNAFCDGLSHLFQVSLPKCLLYNEERPQYEALLRDPVLSQKPLTEVYGCEYLLRLYVRLPFLLPNVDESTSTCVVGPLFSELLILMQKNRQACFKGDYRRPERDEWLESEVKLYRATETNSMEEDDTATTLPS